ncbi:helix-turn-helix domain-containing protein [Streptomyces sp. NPDC059956]|uniref:helix-turn-helix domain-containing protein n=1 Tax=Streptomyces sp. NPDC059956 TaxID=3347015 RepID=UPI00365EBB21
MSFLARMLGVFIQSMPSGTPIGIKDLKKRLSIGETAIAKGLRELVLFGYLDRSLESLPGGRIVTRTVSYNHPRAATVARCRAERAPEAPSVAVPPLREEPPAPPASAPVAPSPVAPSPVAPSPVAPSPVPAPPEPVPEPEPQPGLEPQVTPAVAIRLPAPRDPDDPGRRRLAREVLAELRRVDPRLLLGERDVRYLAGGVEVWLERGAGVQALVAALTAKLPKRLRNPAGFIAHRLAEQVPPPLVPLPRAPAFVPPDPFVNCTKCERAFRSPTPGTCKGCSP